jgi:hypothetical protein
VTVAELAQLLAVVGAHPLSPAYPVWELARPRWPFSRRARDFEASQVRVLDAVRALPWTAFLRTPGDPRLAALRATWQAAARETFVLPKEPGSQVLLGRVLAPGGWTLYLADDPVPPALLPDGFARPPAELAAFAAAHGVPVLVAAARTNQRWRLVVEPAAVPAAVAA